MGPVRATVCDINTAQYDMNNAGVIHILCFGLNMVL
jgi:hypothetical protein